MKAKEQKDLDGKTAIISPVKKTKTSELYVGDYFKVNKSEDANIGVGQKKIDWIAAHMKPFLPMPEGEEGERYSADLQKFIRSIR